MFERHIEAHVLSHPLPIAMHCISIVFGGIIEKFQKIRIAFLEAGSSRVPFLMERMDFELERVEAQLRLASRRRSSHHKDAQRVFHPGQYLRRLRGSGEDLAFVAQWLGDEHIVFPTDFPHSFTFERFVEEVKGFANRKDLPAELSRKILWDNPKRLDGI